jgi:hypothetical protein
MNRVVIFACMAGDPLPSRTLPEADKGKSQRHISHLFAKRESWAHIGTDAYCT